MKRAILATALALSAPLAFGQSGMQGMDKHGDHTKQEKAAAGAARVHQGTGVVKSVNAEKGVVTIAHGPVESLKWPAMTMGFKSKDQKVLQGVKPGQKVSFEFVQQGKDYVITSLR